MRWPTGDSVTLAGLVAGDALVEFMEFMELMEFHSATGENRREQAKAGKSMESAAGVA